MDPLSFGCIPAPSLHKAHSDLGEHLPVVYSGWKLLDNYDACASAFVVLFNGFMSLTSYLMLCSDINITETTYACPFQYVFGNQ